MLVYANSFVLNPDGGPRAIIDQIATWVGQTRRSFVDAARLANGIGELRFADGAALSSRATLDDEDGIVFPYHFCARLVHGQPGVPGRRWVTEVGFRQASDEATLDCSVLLRTDEVSAKVTTPIQVTRPRIVQQLIEHCQPVGETPGLVVIRVTEQNAAAFAYEIEREGRRHPIVQISCDRDGIYPVAPARMRSVVMGLAQVIDIPAEADTYEIQRILGRQYSVFGGAIRIVFPVRRTEAGSFCKTILLRPDQIRDVEESGATIESDVLATITHQTNLPHSWRHISSEMVGQAILRSQLQKAMEEARDSEELAAYESLLKEAADQLENKDYVINELRLDLEDRDANLDQANSTIDGLKHALTGVAARSDNEADQASETLKPLRDTIRAILKSEASLEQSLRLIAGLYPNRIIVLNSALESAKESDRGGFKYGNKAFDLLLKFAEDYWSALSSGQGDQKARKTFGQKAFAAREASSLSNEGKRRRTFTYHGREFLMEKHLKHGVKDSVAETLRIHFEWLADEKKLVIGHCGKHLDF